MKKHPLPIKTLCLLFILLSNIYLFGQQRDNITDKIIFLFDGKKEEIAFIPEIEDVLEDLVIYDDSTTDIKRYEIINIIRLLVSAGNAENNINEITRYYNNDVDKFDPDRNTIYELIEKDIDNSTHLLEVKVKKISDILFFEFIRYDVDMASRKFLYNSRSATSTINLMKVNEIDIKKYFKMAINKVFPRTNRPPKVSIIPNRTAINNDYFYKIGDTLRLIGQASDPDSPKEDISFNWTQLNGKPIFPLSANAESQEIILKEKNTFDLGLSAWDRIENAELEQARFNVLAPPKINWFRFKQTLRPRVKSYYWNFDGIPSYYYADEPELAINLKLDTAYKDTTQLLIDLKLQPEGSFYNANAQPISDIGKNDLQRSDFQFNYFRRIGGYSSIRGILNLPKENVLPPNSYQIAASVSHYGITSDESQLFIVDMVRVKKIGFYTEARFGFIPVDQDNQSTTLSINLGTNIKVSNRFNLLILPGLSAFRKETWQFNARVGAEYDWKKLSRNRNKFFGFDLATTYYSKLFSGDRELDNIFSLNTTIFYKHHLTDRPVEQIKYGIFFEYYESSFISDIFGVSVALLLYDHVQKTKIKRTN